MSNSFIKNSDGTVSLSPEKIQIARDRIMKIINFPMDLRDKSLIDFDVYHDVSGAPLSEADSKKKTRALEIAIQYRDALGQILKGEKIPVISASGQTFFSNSIVFCGKEGSGKTLLIASLLRQCLDHTSNVEYIKWLNMVTTSSKFVTDKQYIDLQSCISRRRLIVIDDIDDIEMKPWIKTNLSALLDIRVHNGLPFLIGSNLSPEKLIEKMPHPGKTLVSKSIIVALPDSHTQLYTIV